MNSIEADLGIFASMKSESQSLRDTSKHLWRFLQQMQVTPEADIFDKIGARDVVEVYFVDASGQRQMFRNLRFFECVSYTIEQLYGLDWRIGSAREQAFEEAIYSAAIAIMSGQVTSTLALDIPPHSVKELDSPGLYTLMITMKFLSPVRKSGKVLGAIAINHTDVIGSAK